MKTTIVSDIHIGDYSYGRTNIETGLNTRLLDFLHNLDETIEFSIKKKVDAYVIVGDIYRVKHPNSKLRKQFAKRLCRLIKENIRVLLITGNHDMTTTSDGAHSLSEIEELSELIDGLEVYSIPDTVVIKDTELFLLPFVNRGEQNLLTVQDFLNYQKEVIDGFNICTQKSKSKYRLFFGHFGTDKSVIGNSFDLDMSANEDENKISLSSFDEGKWTKIYLGHIHKQQEFNDVARHVGSLGRVDFSEENEEKGFYYHVDGKDEFVKVQDREFKTFDIDLTSDKYSKTMSEFLNNIQEYDLTKSIVRVNVTILQTYLPLIRFTGLETYLKDNSWHSLGVSLDIISSVEVKDSERITTSDAPDMALKKHIEKYPERFTGIEKKALQTGIDILKTVKSEE